LARIQHITISAPTAENMCYALINTRQCYFLGSAYSACTSVPRQKFCHCDMIQGVSKQQ